MDNLRDLKPKDILMKLESGELYLSDREIQDVALTFENDEDKIAILKYTVTPIKIIRSLKSEESILKALEGLSDEEKARVAARFIKEESNKIKAIEAFKDKDKAFPIKISLSREGFRKYFLREEEIQYQEIGLDKNITFGLEIESLGKESEKILETAKANETIMDQTKEVECGKLLIRENQDSQVSWIAMLDGSLVVGAGLEMVSPILTDNIEDVEDVYMVCNMLEECGQEIGNCCGGHVHIGSDYLTSKESYANLFEIFGNTEKILYIMSNEKGMIPREGIRKTCITYFKTYK